jgi:TetR/AcrR family transcriptional regulator, transcriptional repressor for nem operon
VRKGEQTRQAIIRKAAPIFNQRGYDGAALSDLMKATGLEKGGIYRHFDSKQQLAAEAFDYAWRETLDARIVEVKQRVEALATQTVGMEMTGIKGQGISVDQVRSRFERQRSP